MMILAATPSLAAPRAEDRYESRQRSYRMDPVDAARIPMCTCSRGRRQQRLASSFAASRSRLHGSTVRFAGHHPPRARFLRIARTSLIVAFCTTSSIGSYRSHPRTDIYIYDCRAHAVGDIHALVLREYFPYLLFVDLRAVRTAVQVNFEFVVCKSPRAIVSITSTE